MYRDAATRTHADFIQHITIARSFHADVVAALARIRARWLVGAEAPALCAVASGAWQRLWEQLGEARDLVRAWGGDVRAFDLARTNAGDLSSDDRDSRDDARALVHRTLRSINVELASSAIEILVAAVPESVARARATT